VTEVKMVEGPLAPVSAKDGGMPGPQDIQRILSLHNQVRAQVKPSSGGPLPKMRWNHQLAQSAKRHALRCKFKHSSTNKLKRVAGFTFIGENLGAASGPPFDVVDAAKMWAQEKKNYNYKSNRCRGVCGHYTQMVWRDTTDIGCYVAVCPQNRFEKIFVVCQYGPAGNIVGKRPY
jgi:uncharacterized protein YkwD